MSPLLNSFDAAFAEDGCLWVSVNVYTVLPVCLLFALLRITKKEVLLGLSALVVLVVAILASQLDIPQPRSGVLIDNAAYAVNTSALSEPSSEIQSIREGQLHNIAQKLHTTFLQSYKDEATEEFLATCRNEFSTWTGRWATAVKSKLSRFLQSVCGWSRTDVSGALRMADMFVASPTQLRKLLQTASLKGSVRRPLKSMLDIGAGNGVVTDIFSSALGQAAAQVTAVETSSPLRRALLAKGYQAISSLEELPKPGKFDVITLLNVLDRCDAPDDLLKAALDRLSVDGLLFVATVLPFCDKVHEGKVGKIGHGRAPRKPLRVLSAGRCKKQNPPFELAASAFAAAAFDRHGLEVIAWTRLPYLCSGDKNKAWYSLTNALFLLRHIPEGARLREDSLASVTNETQAQG
eukprot:TRINITY_DN13389_c0_g1_i2.p1 TRINITY_DN13389_c0_g1~~TRINITY_DN13389_c0_g1_i2.p1  ORF type:complete len:407 (+),score=56.87 TRINITY_DN13389_c0_g1_i2:34-1254(+)